MEDNYNRVKEVFESFGSNGAKFKEYDKTKAMRVDFSENTHAYYTYGYTSIIILNDKDIFTINSNVDDLKSLIEDCLVRKQQ